MSKFICRFGVPRQLHSDQGTNFESKVFAEVCRLFDIEKTCTTLLHPQSDGQVERFNRTLIEMLRGKIQQDQTDWDLQLLGRDLKVPLDVITERQLDASSLRTDYAQVVQQRLASAHDLARRHLNKAAVRQKRNYDERLSGRSFVIGDSVWLHNFRRK